MRGPEYLDKSIARSKQLELLQRRSTFRIAPPTNSRPGSPGFLSGKDYAGGCARRHCMFPHCSGVNSSNGIPSANRTKPQLSRLPALSPLSVRNEILLEVTKYRDLFLLFLNLLLDAGDFAGNGRQRILPRSFSSLVFEIEYVDQSINKEAGGLRRLAGRADLQLNF